MENNINSFKKNIFDKVGPGYKRVEEFDSKNKAEKMTIFYRRKGHYFAFCAQVGGKWRVYIE